jgi:hypothetical protein
MVKLQVGDLVGRRSYRPLTDRDVCVRLGISPREIYPAGRPRLTYSEILVKFPNFYEKRKPQPVYEIGTVKAILDNGKVCIEWQHAFGRKYTTVRLPKGLKKLESVG